MDKLKELCLYMLKNNIISEIKSEAILNTNQPFTKFEKLKYLEVFDFHKKGKRLIEKKKTNGNIPYISAKETENGISGFIGNPLFIEKDAITYSTFGDAFYQQGEFTASDEVTIFKNKKMNIYSAIYIITEMQKNKQKYYYANKAFKNKWEDDEILVPVDNAGNIDWNYMENYIKNSKYSINL